MPGPVFLTDKSQHEQVALHAVSDTDISFLADGRNHPDIRPWMPRSRPQTPAAVRETYDGYISDDSPGTNLLICVEEDPIGFISLFNVEPDSGRAELAIWVLPTAQENGYATAAMDLFITYAFTERRLHRLIAGARADNDASRAVLEGLGFTEEGRQRDHFFVDGGYVDHVLYGLLSHEWLDE